MAEQLTSEPPRVHRTPSPGPSSQTTSLEAERTRHRSGEALLHQDDDTIATELPELPAPVHHDDLRRRSSGTLSTAHDDRQYALRPELVRSQTRQEEEEDAAHRAAGLHLQRYRLVRVQRKWYHPFLSWWGNHVSIKVDPKYRRDHLALERTFLGYLRTSLALSMCGIVIAQLFRLQKSPSASAEFGYYVSGEPLAACFLGASIIVVLLGAIRFWRQQRAMVRGKIWAGGWEVYLTMGVGVAVTIGLFAVAIGVMIKHGLDEASGLRP